MSITKKTSVIVVLVILCAWLHIVFPSNGIFQNMMAAVMFLFVVPFLSFRMILGARNEDMGLSKGNWRLGVMWGTLSLVGSLITFLLLMNLTELGAMYSLPQIVEENFWLFIAYIAIMSIYVAVFVFFLSGIVVHGLRDAFGFLVVFVQFGVLVMILGWDPIMTTFFVMSPFAALTAYYSRSIYYPIASSALFVLLADAIFIAMNR